jgi:hypothetical protein
MKKTNNFMAILKTVLVIAFAAIIGFGVTACGGGSNNIDGIWEGQFMGSPAEFIFVNDMFFIKGRRSIDSAKFSYSKGEGVLSLFSDLKFTVKGKTLTLNQRDGEVVFTKKDGKAPGEIAGIWKEPRGFYVIIINDLIIMTDEDDKYSEFGTYSFKNNSGSFNMDNDYNGTFTVSGNILNAIEGEDEEKYTYTKIY